MMAMNKYRFAALLTCTVALGFSTDSAARQNVNSTERTNNGGGNRQSLLRTAAGCTPATAAIDLDINNVRARLMTGGDMWWDQGTTEARYEVPKGTKKNSLFAGSVWIGGIDDKGQLKVAAQTYRQSGNDYWPGPLDASANIDANTCNDWDRFWKINRSDILRFIELGPGGASESEFQTIFEWPGKGNPRTKGTTGNILSQVAAGDQEYAPYREVNNVDGYQPEAGDYPEIAGDQYVWWVFNDKGNVKQETNTEGIGIEVQASAFAFSTKDFLNDATFYNYRVINRSNLSLDSTYIATWTDADLGYYFDDYIGCDTVRGLGILYNGRSFDGQGEANSYADKIPMVGVDFFKGPSKRFNINGRIFDSTLNMEAFTYYNNDGSVIGNPQNGNHVYGYMTGSIRNGERFRNDFKGPNTPSVAYGDGSLTRFVYTGDPGEKTQWSECTCNNVPADRRFVHSSGPFTLAPGVVNDITIGAIWVSEVGGCPNTSFKKIRVADDQAQALFDNNFETIEGPEAPRLVAREMDRKVIFYLVNDPASTNYQERYGRDTAAKYRVSSVKAAKYVKSPDSLYKFEGYRVFQVKTREVQPAQIFNEDGELNTDVALEVFQCDIRNNVVRIINYEKDTDISDTTFRPVVKVVGRDSGIRHSFEVTLDQFATGADKRLVNYRNYYYIAIAYAYNDFSFNPVTGIGGFNPLRADSTQDVAYLESAKGAGGTPIQVVAAMPNPANGDMGTVLNSDYGSGVIIKRLEGTGNGGNDLNMSAASELEALQGPNYRSLNPIYQAGYGPINVRVVDPLKVKPLDWELFITGPSNGNRGLDSFSSTWTLKSADGSVTIMNDRDTGISSLNEQILEDYGISVSIMQVGKPGDNQIDGNGYITSDLSYANSSIQWLAGVQDGEQREITNWIRSGQNVDEADPGEDPLLCNYNDEKYDTAAQVYEGLLPNYPLNRGTWAPYALANAEDKPNCPVGGLVKANTANAITVFNSIPSVDIVFTPDKSKWSRCVVLEMQDLQTVAEGRAEKFDPRSHRSWSGDIDGDGRPVYSSDPNDTGFSLFPGYAINQETGERLNIVFGEDSWLKTDNGSDMLWNPSSRILNDNGDAIFGGKHYVYVMGTKYDGCAAFAATFTNSVQNTIAFQQFRWTGIPTLAPGQSYASLSAGIIPTETRLRLRVTRPYAIDKLGIPDNQLRNGGNPLYSFTTKGLSPTPLSDNPDVDKQALLDQIHAVPNPYYGYTAYEQNRLDTRIRIINLPRTVSISIYSLDGSLIRRLSKDNPNVSYVDWDLRNAKGLPIASGMYLIHVNAEGIGETVLRWFGSMRPTDIVVY